MASNKLFTNIVTGAAIVASLGTSGMAGFRVLANRSVDTEVPDVATPTPSPAPTGSPVGTVAAEPTSIPSAAPSAEPTVLPSAIPSTLPSPSDFPVASLKPGAGFDDDGDDDTIEHEESEELDSQDETKTEDHEDD